MDKDPSRDLFLKVFLQWERATTQGQLLAAAGRCLPSYLMLLQHSTRQELRLQQHAPDTQQTRHNNQNNINNNTIKKQEQHILADEGLYRRAGVLPPWEAALRDFCAGELWLRHVVEQLVLAAALATAETNAQRTIVLWCSTKPTRKPWLERLSKARPDNLRVVDSFLHDPWGWDLEEEHEQGGLNSLDRMLETLQTTVNTEDDVSVGGIVVESLTPLVMRHGFARTTSFLQRLQQQTGKNRSRAAVTVAPVLTDLLSPSQHVVLEDMAQSVLCLHDQGGQHAVWLHQGVRERSNLVREVLPYSVVVDAVSKDRKIQLLDSQDQDEDQKGASSAVAEQAKIKSGVSGEETTDVSSSSSNKSSERSSKKIQIAFSEQSRQTAETETAPSETAAPAPQIYVEEDDPEFDDYDEEDPDDDLDL